MSPYNLLLQATAYKWLAYKRLAYKRLAYKWLAYKRLAYKRLAYKRLAYKRLAYKRLAYTTCFFFFFGISNDPTLESITSPFRNKSCKIRIQK